MCTIQDRAESNSGSNSFSQSGNFGDDSEKFAYIRNANNKVKLIDILHNYGIKVEPNYQRPEWSVNITCPFKTHKGAKERTPSFGYCFERDFFSCFGCHSSGRSVEFISLYEQVPRHIVANRILEQFENYESDDSFEYKDDITPVLLDGSKFLQEQIQKHKNNPDMLKTINKLIWWIDCYLVDKVTKHTIQSKDLLFRLNKVKELLST